MGDAFHGLKTLSTRVVGLAQARVVLTPWICHNGRTGVLPVLLLQLSAETMVKDPLLSQQAWHTVSPSAWPHQGLCQPIEILPKRCARPSTGAL